MSPDRNELVLALRAFTELVEASDEAPAPRRRKRIRHDLALVIDDETGPDAIQSLIFGGFSYGRRKRKGFRPFMVGLVHADNLPEAQVAILREYVATHKADVAPGGRHAIQLYTLTEFLNEVFYPAAYISRALVVGFNLFYDLTRLAADAGEGRGRYRNGFSLIYWPYRDDAGRLQAMPQRPRLGIRNLDSKRSFIEFLPPMEGATAEQPNLKGPRGVFHGRFVDLRTLVFALTNESHSLASACRRFHVEHGKEEAKEHGVITPEYIGYNLRDVLATQELLNKLLEEFSRHPIRLDVTGAYSPASVAKAYLDTMGLVPPAIKFGNFPKEVLGQLVTTFFGGRAEARIRNTVVPVVHCDFLSMYPTVNTLMGLFRFLMAERLEVREATEEVRTWLAGVATDGCFNPAFWAKLPFFALIEPRGEILPARSRYGTPSEGFNIGVNPLESRTPLWFAGPDLVAATLLSGRPPHILRAIRLVPVGVQRKLKTVHLRGSVAIDPTRDDFFQSVIEARQRVKAHPAEANEVQGLDAFLKVLANAGAYGIFMEMNRNPRPVGEQAAITVYGLDGAFAAETNGPEEAGEYCFPPIAALIPAAARLMLALLERCVTDLGGTYAMCDTDSLGIVANATGTPIACKHWDPRTETVRRTLPALSWDQVQAIVDRFAALTPYDRTVVPGSILKIEPENFALDAEGKPTGPRRQLSGPQTRCAGSSRAATQRAGLRRPGIEGQRI